MQFDQRDLVAACRPQRSNGRSPRNWGLLDAAFWPRPGSLTRSLHSRLSREHRQYTMNAAQIAFDATPKWGQFALAAPTSWRPPSKGTPQQGPPAARQWQIHRVNSSIAGKASPLRDLFLRGSFPSASATIYEVTPLRAVGVLVSPQSAIADLRQRNRGCSQTRREILPFLVSVRVHRHARQSQRNETAGTKSMACHVATPQHNIVVLPCGRFVDARETRGLAQTSGAGLDL